MWLNKSVEYVLNQTSTPTAAQNTEFRELIIAELVSASPQITEVSGEDAVLICGKLKLSFAASTISNAIYYIKISASYGENSYALPDINVCSSSAVSGKRIYRINFHIASDTAGNIIDVKIRSYPTGTTSLNFNNDILYMLTDNQTELFGYTGIANGASAATTRNFASLSLQGSYTMQNRMPYIHDSDSTKLDTISGKVLTVGGIRAEHVGGLLDSTYIAGDGLYPSGSDKYYAVDDYSLIKV